MTGTASLRGGLGRRGNPGKLAPRALLYHWVASLRSQRRKNTMREIKQPAVYILASKRNGTLYTGVTSAVARRVYQHRTGAIGGFTAKYECKLLVYYEAFDRMEDAITREKQIKAGSRAKKIALIESVNSGWVDLYETLF
jgi:putative endonuclease